MVDRFDLGFGSLFIAVVIGMESLEDVWSILLWEARLLFKLCLTVLFLCFLLAIEEVADDFLTILCDFYGYWPVVV